MNLENRIRQLNDTQNLNDFELNATITNDYNYRLAYFTNVKQNALESKTECLNNYFNVMYNIVCTLVSSDSDKFVSYSYDNENAVFTIKANTPTVGLALSNCMPLIEIYCLMGYGISIADTIMKGSNETNTEYRIPPDRYCLKLQQTYNCTHPFCFEKQANILISDFFEFEYIPFFFDKNVVKMVLNMVNQFSQVLLFFEESWDNDRIIAAVFHSPSYFDFGQETVHIELEPHHNGAFLGFEGGSNGGNLFISGTGWVKNEIRTLLFLILILFN